MITPNHATDTQINRLVDGFAVETRHRDLPLRVQIDPEVKVVELTAALAYSGFTLRHNPESGDLYLTKVGAK